MRSAILYFNPDPAKLGKIRFMCMRMNVQLKLFPVSQWGLTMGELWQIQPDADAPEQPAPFTDEVLVMCDFNRTQVNMLLDGMKQAHLAPISLKAILTPTNSTWTPEQLVTELRKEHEAMHGGSAPAHQS